MSTALASRPDAGPIVRERWWWRFALGDDDPVTPAWSLPADGPPVADDVGRDLAPSAVVGRARPWPAGATARLAAQPYAAPRGPGGEGDADPVDAWGHVVAATFGPTRRDPDNPYNDHRAYPSARCLFPVRAFERSAGRVGLLQPDAHATLDLGPDRDGRADPGPSLALTGRYTAVPALYGWMRGSLVGLELGIVLRQLAVAATLRGLPLRVTPPGEGSVPDDVPLDDPGAWSPVWRVGPARPHGAGLPRPTVAPRDDDPCLREVADVLARHPVTGPTVPLPAGVPDDLVPPAEPTEPVDWAEVMWRRGSGRMPRGLHGFSFLRRPVPAEALADAVVWLRHAPPSGLLADVHAATTVRVVLQGVDGVRDGLHRLTPDGLREERADPRLAAAIEAGYGYPRDAGVGCGIGSATALWFLTVRPRDLVETHGPAAWTAAQLAAGWATQGLCLSAAAHDLVARPMRAFPEAGVADALGLEPDEMLAIAVCVGTDPPVGGVQLDLRT